MNSRIRKIIVLVILILVLTGGIWKFYNRTEDPDAINSWSGDWKFYYFYETDSNLIYNGSMQVDPVDSTISIEILAPKSTRAEKIQIEDWSLNAEGILSGSIVHSLYKIQGGNPSESFQWKVNNDGSFNGTGACIEFCPEGTEEARILWQGTRHPL